VAAVEPEESKTFELGTKWELMDDNLLVAAALFRTEKTNARETDPVTTSLTVLSGEQVVEGLELSAVGRLSNVWNVYAGYTYMDSEITESVNAALIGNDLSNTPENTFNFWTTYSFMPALEVGFGTQFIDDRFSATNNERIASSYYLFNSMVSYTVTPNLSFRLNGTNLANKDYLANVGGGHAIPGDGRTVILSVDFNL
jgi:catecholate siderophore receptor